MLLEFVGKFYDNHSLSIVNRNIALSLAKKGYKLRIVPLDSYDITYNLDAKHVDILKKLETSSLEEIPEVQVRHSYPPIWEWPTHEQTKIVYIQPWEYPKALFEWQYKFETFADALIVPSNYCKQIFTKGGLKTSKVHVMANGYDDSLFNTSQGNSVEHLGVDTNKFNFIYVGNSQWRKGLDILLNVWSRTFSKADNARLIIKDNPRVYGKTSMLQEIIKIQYKTECAGITYIDDDLSANEMADLYKASKVLVHPYRAEGFAMHVQEAAACGCVPIIPANGPTDDFIPSDKGFRIAVQPVPINIQDPGLFVLKPGDATTMMSTHTFINEPIPEYLARALNFIYHSHDREQILSNVRVKDMPNTWDTIVDKYIEVFASLEGKETIRK